MYNKQDAKMTQGLAILSMLILHLFCRKGLDVYGSPILWINETTPLVYLFGFFAEICVPLYCLTIGYAQELLYESGKSKWSNRKKRILKLMINYWVIVVLFSIIGLIIHDKSIPGSGFFFLKSLVLLHSYNGAWWFLHSYILLLLIPPGILLLPVRQLKLRGGAVLCSILTVICYLLEHFGFRISYHVSNGALKSIFVELENLLGILPAIWFGAFMCKHKLFEIANTLFNKHVSGLQKQRIVLAVMMLAVFIIINTIQKALLISFGAVAVFIIFNLWEKRELSSRLFLFLGKHSTNIWLTHMFFYLVLFPGLVQQFRYPVFMLAALFVFSTISSIIINMIIHQIDRLINNISI